MLNFVQSYDLYVTFPCPLIIFTGSKMHIAGSRPVSLSGPVSGFGAVLGHEG